MNNLMMLKDLLKDKQIVMAIYGQIVMDLKGSTSIRKLLQSILLQEFTQTQDLAQTIKRYERAKQRKDAH